MQNNASKPAPVGAMTNENTWTETVWIPDSTDAYEIHVERIARELKVEHIAAIDGHEMRPPRADTMINQTQSEICQNIFSGILRLNEFLNEQIDTGLSRARSLVRRRLNDAAEIQREITEAVEKTISEQRGRLREDRLADLSASRGLRKFKSDHGLHREAHYKQSIVLVCAILTAIFLVESLLNGLLLSSVMQHGLIEGFGIATIISGLNIFLGICAGLYGWRLFSHHTRNLRYIGMAITITCHIVAISWNIFVANFREIAELAASNPNYNFDVSTLGAETFRHIAQFGILHLTSVASWALLLVGICVHFYASKEGWDDLADRYYDYKKYHLRSEVARRNFHQTKEGLRSGARDAAELAQQKSKSLAEEAHRAAQEVAKILDVVLQRRQEVKNSEDQWVAGGTRLLKMYRDKNVEIRDFGSAPEYLRSYPSAADYRNATFGAFPPSEKIALITRSVDEQISALQGLLTEANKIKGNADEAVLQAKRYADAFISQLDRRLGSVDEVDSQIT